MVGSFYDGPNDQAHEFTQWHFDLLAIYLTKNPQAPFYSLYANAIRFNQFVGVIKVGDLSIEVLPKTDRHSLIKADWQKVLLQMLLISLQVKARTTTRANITVRQHTVLETYLSLFLEEATKLIHQGLVKKYRTNISNQAALKGKLLVHQQLTKNALHAERFYVAHQVYDRDNIYNYLIKSALECVRDMGAVSLSKEAQALLLYFPKCQPVKINEKLFSRLSFDRKTEDYRRSIELARIILLNYHPDLRGGTNDILAIMFDMNYLWESFITWSLARALNHNEKLHSQSRRAFWCHQDNWTLHLKPDILVQFEQRNVVIDTKWKFQSGLAINDIRQLFAYQHYFSADKGYLLYPERLVDEHVELKQGHFYKPNLTRAVEEYTNLSCGMLYADLIKEGKLNLDIGQELLQTLRNEEKLI